MNLELRASEKGIQDKRSYRYSYQYRWEPRQGRRGILRRQERGQAVTRTAHVGGSQEVTGAGGPGERDGNGAAKSRRLETCWGWRRSAFQPLTAWGGKCDSQEEGEPELRRGNQEKPSWLGKAMSSVLTSSRICEASPGKAGGMLTCQSESWTLKWGPRLVDN